MKNPPPFVPSSLIDSCEATGPPGIFWTAPSSVVTSRVGWKFWMTPWEFRTIAETRLMGSRTQSVDRTRSCQKLPIPFDSVRAIPRTMATASAMPVAAETKLWIARPAIWVRWDIVASPV